MSAQVVDYATRKIRLHDLTLESIKEAQAIVGLSNNWHDTEAFVHLRRYWTLRANLNYCLNGMAQLVKSRKAIEFYIKHLSRLSSRFRLLFTLFFRLVY